MIHEPDSELGIIITDVADHFGIYHIIYGTPRLQSVVRQVRQLTPRNIASFRNLLDMVDYSTVLSTAYAN